MIPVHQRTTPLFLLAAAITTLSLLTIYPHSTHAANPFSSNVVELTSRNWRTEVEESPHAVFVNICRQGCGYCQQLASEWERLAVGVKGTIKIAYWDTEQGGARPRILGEVKGTPTIRMFKPKKKQGNTDKAKVVLDYNQERKAKDMKKFVDYQMPEFVEHVKGEKGLEVFQEKAVRNALPQVLLFTSKTGTSPLTKYLSTEFRRRILLGQIEPSKPNQSIIDKYEIKEFPALLVIPPITGDDDEEQNAEIIRYEGTSFTRNKLHMFLSTHALKTKVQAKKKTEEPKKETEQKPPEKEKVRTEL